MCRALRPCFPAGFKIVLIHVLDEEEVHPTLTGDLRLIDSETGDAREVSISPHLLGQYEAQLTSFCGGLQTLSNRYNMDYVRASTGVPFEDVILKFLRSGGLLK